jgi:hypothetical protein
VVVAMAFPHHRIPAHQSSGTLKEP